MVEDKAVERNVEEEANDSSNKGEGKKEDKASQEVVKVEKKPNWIKMKKSDVEKLVVDLAKQGKGPSQIGLELRDKHGIPKTKLFGKRISEILDEKEVEYKSEQNFIENRITNLKDHISKNKHDYPASRALTKKLWVINKLER